jgi:hypothetical protein
MYGDPLPTRTACSPPTSAPTYLPGKPTPKPSLAPTLLPTRPTKAPTTSPTQIGTVTCTTNGAAGCCSLCTSKPCIMTFTSDITYISDSAFYSCTKLTSVVISSGITSIGSNAFYSCSSLTSVSIADSVTMIGSDAFTGCPFQCITWNPDIYRNIAPPPSMYGGSSLPTHDIPVVPIPHALCLQLGTGRASRHRDHGSR